MPFRHAGGIFAVLFAAALSLPQNRFIQKLANEPNGAGLADSPAPFRADK
jgi:hypothetical protein